jgi:hypothetical protein
MAKEPVIPVRVKSKPTDAHERFSRSSKGTPSVKKTKLRNTRIAQPLSESRYSKATSNKKIHKINAIAKSKDSKSIKFHSGNLNPSKGMTRDSMKFELDMLRKQLKKNKINPDTNASVKKLTRALNESKSGPSVAKKNVNVKRGAANKMKAQGARAMSSPTSGYGKSTRPRGK